MQRNFESMRKTGGSLAEGEPTDVSAKVVIYEAFGPQVEQKKRAPST